jgi:hypothetical protein
LKRNSRKSLNLTATHAAQAIHVLIADGKIAARDVTAALKRREEMIHDLRHRLAALEGGPQAKDGPFAMTTDVARRGRRRTRPKLSAARRAALKLHGRYIGSVRTLPKAAKAKIKALRERRGVRAAIAAAKKMAK